ncbi:hypothetical protein K501DRAFT_289358 [Backusella circina FSU 941]|nr:hypothetical protein K501DRAFT_289358 [Backusella circina FSU 941]
MELPTIEQYCDQLLEACAKLLSSTVQQDEQQETLLKDTLAKSIMLIERLDVLEIQKQQLKEKLTITDSTTQVIFSIQDTCHTIKRIIHQLPHLSYASKLFRREKTRIIPPLYLNQANPINEKASWFRKYFVGKPYTTWIGSIENEIAVISISREYEREFGNKESQYRIIVRTNQDMNMGFLVQELDAKDLLLHLESINQAHRLEIESKQRSRPLRSFSSAIISSTHSSSTPLTIKMMRAALVFLFQSVEFKQFKELSAETTILAGLEKEFLKYDELGIPKYYKFGVLTVREGQHTEEEWFSNSGLTPGLRKLLDVIGRPVGLLGYKGYAAGLDTKTGESGETSYISSWNDHEIMYHVASLMPSRQNDAQQVHRKRYIGNDIVCIVFIEGKNQKFDPESIRSQFLHVFILIYLEQNDEQAIWRVEVVHDKNVAEFGPPIPSPPLFYNEHELGDFLILKLVNAENVSLQADKFALPNTKARQAILKSLIETGMEANQLVRSISRLSNTSVHNDATSSSGNHSSNKKGFSSTLHERPKSAGAHHQLTRSVKSSFSSKNESNVIVESSRSLTPELPPVPSISRSNVLRDLKSLRRRKSSNNNNTRLLLLQDADDAKKGTSSFQVESNIGMRTKAHNLMNSMIGRRNSRTGSPRT